MTSAEETIKTGWTVVALHKHQKATNYWWPTLEQALAHLGKLQLRKNIYEITVRDRRGFVNSHWRRDAQGLPHST